MTYLAEIHLLKPFEKWNLNLKIKVTVHALSQLLLWKFIISRNAQFGVRLSKSGQSWPIS